MGPKKVNTSPKTKEKNCILDRHPYLSKILKFDPNDSGRIVCQLCSDNQPLIQGTRKIISFLRKGLSKHLGRKGHRGFTPPEDKNSRREARNAIRQGPEEQDSDDESDESDQEMIIEGRGTPNSRANQESPLSRNKEAELYLTLAQFIIDEHLPFSIGPKLLGLIQTFVSDYHPQLITRSHTSDTSLALVINKCIGNYLQEELYEVMRRVPFSLMLDGSSDIYGDKYLALIIRYIDKKSLAIQTKLISIIELGSINTADELEKKINQELFNNEPKILKNIMGICSDNEAKMVGSKGGGVCNKLMEQIKHLVHVRDTCHSLNLVIEHSLEDFPSYIIQFIRKLGNYFNSGNRPQHFKEFQASKKKKLLQVIQYIDSRWASLSECTTRLLRLWDELENFFIETPDKTFLSEFTGYEYKTYVSLLNILIARLVMNIKCFEKPDMVFDEVFKKLKQTFTIYARLLLKGQHQALEFEDVFKISFEKLEDPANAHLIANISEFKANFNAFQPSFEENVKKLYEEKAQKRMVESIDKEIYGNARRFIAKVLLNMKKTDRLPFEDNLLNDIQAIYLNKSFEMKTWQSLAKTFQNIITEDLETPFALDLQNFGCEYKTIQENYKSSGLTIIQKWEELSKETQFPILSLLAKALLIMPYSTAPVESVFSEFKTFKTPYRNRLSIANLQASVLSEQADFKVTSQMIERYFSMRDLGSLKERTILRPESVPEEEKSDNNEKMEIQENTLEDNNQKQLNLQGEFLNWAQPLLSNLFTQWLSVKNNGNSSFLINGNSDSSNNMGNHEYIQQEGSFKSRPNQPLLQSTNSKPGLFRPSTLNSSEQIEENTDEAA